MKESEDRGILFEAAANKKEDRSRIEGRMLVPGIHQKLDNFFNTNINRDDRNRPLYDHEGWGFVELTVLPHDDVDEKLEVKLAKHSSSDAHWEGYIKIDVEQYNYLIVIRSTRIEMSTREVLPERPLTYTELVHGARDRKPIPRRTEPSLHDVHRIGNLVDTICDPQIGVVKRS